MYIHSLSLYIYMCICIYYMYAIYIYIYIYMIHIYIYIYIRTHIYNERETRVSKLDPGMPLTGSESPHVHLQTLWKEARHTCDIAYFDDAYYM